MDQKLGRRLRPLSGRVAGSPPSKMWPGLRPTSLPNAVLIHPAVWPQRTWEGEAGSPSKTMWPGPRPTYVPSFILIHPTVLPQYTNVTDRQDRQDRTDRQTGQTTVC